MITLTWRLTNCVQKSSLVAYTFVWENDKRVDYSEETIEVYDIKVTE